MSRIRPSFIKSTRMMTIIGFAALLSLARGFRYDEVGGEKKVATSNVNLRKEAEVYGVEDDELSGGAAVGFERLAELANKLLSIMAKEGGAANPAGAVKFGPELQQTIRDYIDDVPLTKSFAYQAISLERGLYCSVTATTRWAAMLEAAFEQSGSNEQGFRERFPELSGWSKSSNSDTQQWAYVLPFLWSDRSEELFPKLKAWDSVMQGLEEALPTVLMSLNAKMGMEGTVDSFLAPMLKYISELPAGDAGDPAGGWEVKVHGPMAEIALPDGRAKANELYTGSSLVADLIVLGEKGQELMKVGWAEDGGLVQANSVPGLRVLPPYKTGESEEMKRVYFSSMFQVGDTWGV